ncbi:MAG: tRNA pseudouridine(13) synthase TruD [Methylobacter sp.]|nr:MAG: tRNA pseudouridine(13) synthase TruD [Methylobacter sp.]PPD20748.1 MAG: tRNA pseudouridine(13) synthase TruD [Methylobacter sp.]PPD37530.1 MAG: tRNA pseudouridine(13) synthase TruD [Methylomonas sp.]
MAATIEIPLWPHAYGQPAGNGQIRTTAEDFRVYETLAFEPSGTGEHAFLYVEKTDENTEYTARQLAKHAGVRQRDIGYAGLKDRHAVTRQWFSIWLPGKPDPDWQALNSSSLQVLKTTRHTKKLKRGALASNRFDITIRQWQGDKDNTLKRLETIQAKGIANYFGSQRFGNNGQNINKALEFFAGAKTKREQRSLYLSAARSFLFNEILAERIRQNTWDQAIPGDILMFDNSNSCFAIEQPDQDIKLRIDELAIHPSAVLWGTGQWAARLDALQSQQNIINQYPELRDGLINAAVEKDNRPLRVRVEQFEWRFVADDTLTLEFNLPPGSYATSVLREIIEPGN